MSQINFAKYKVFVSVLITAAFLFVSPALSHHTVNAQSLPTETPTADPTQATPQASQDEPAIDPTPTFEAPASPINEAGDPAQPLDISGDVATSSTLSFGQTVLGSIISAGEVVRYTFSANAGDKVLVRIGKISGEYDPRIAILGPDSTELCEYGGNYYAELSNCPSLPTSGIYTLEVYDWYNRYTGDYYLYLQRLNLPGGASSITFGKLLYGPNLTPVSVKTYTFSATAGDKVFARVSNVTEGISSEIRIFSPDGIQLCQDDGTQTAEIVSCPLTKTGTYSIFVDDSEFMGTDDFYLFLQRVNKPSYATSISFGMTSSGSILVSPAEVDTYSFIASAGTRITVKMSVTSGSMSPEIRVYSPTGIKLCEDYGNYGLDAEITSCSLPLKGTYTILADDAFGFDTGNYKLFMNWTNNPGAFSKTSPTNGALNQMPNVSLVWAASSTASSYDYCYDTTNDNNCSNWKSNGASTRVTLSGLASNTTYYWQVRAKNSDGTSAFYSNDGAWWSFKTRTLVTKQFYSVGTEDGWILETSELSGLGGTLSSASVVFRLGDDASRKQYRSILSFSTGAVIPDNAVITSVKLKILKSTVSGGGDPVSIFQGFMADVIKGYFGTSYSLQASDFQAAGGTAYGPFSVTPSSNFYTIDLSGSKTLINKLSTSSGRTQIRLRFKLDDNNNSIANYMSFMSGNNSTNKPMLIVTYYIP